MFRNVSTSFGTESISVHLKSEKNTIFCGEILVFEAMIVVGEQMDFRFFQEN